MKKFYPIGVKMTVDFSTRQALPIPIETNKVQKPIRYDFIMVLRNSLLLWLASLMWGNLHATPLFNPGKDCLNEVLNSISKKNIPLNGRAKLESAARYNEEIFNKASDLDEVAWNRSIQSSIDHFADYDHSLDAASFKKWLIENPSNPQQKDTIGSYLNQRFQEYKKTNPSKDLGEISRKIPDDLKKIAENCGKNQACNEQKIRTYLIGKINGTCLGKNKNAAMRSMVTGLTLASAGYFASYLNHPENGYPYDMMVNTLFWTPILSEMGCRNTLAKGEIGKKINHDQISRKEKIKIGMNNYIEYTKIAPLTNMTYVTFHTIRQLANGEKNWDDVNVVDLSKQVVSLTLLDAAVLVPRSVLVTDPLFMKAFPKLRSAYYRKLPNQVAAEATYLATDFGSRIGINFLSTELINVWIKKSDELWDTQFASEEKKKDHEKN